MFRAGVALVGGSAFRAMGDCGCKVVVNRGPQLPLDRPETRLSTDWRERLPLGVGQDAAVHDGVVPDKDDIALVMGQKGKCRCYKREVS